MDYLKALSNRLKQDLEKTQRSLREVKKVREGAASAMESQHDMTRARAESEIEMYKNKIRELETSLKLIPKRKPKEGQVGLWSYVETETGNGKMKAVIVPEGMGGRQIGGVRYISEKTPIGKRLIKNEK